MIQCCVVERLRENLIKIYIREYWRSHTSGVRGVRTPCHKKVHNFWYMISRCYRPTRRPLKLADVSIFLSIRLSRASIDSKRILHTMCATPLMGMDRKECYRLTHPLSKIFGYATDNVVPVNCRA